MKIKSLLAILVIGMAVEMSFPCAIAADWGEDDWTDWDDDEVEVDDEEGGEGWSSSSSYYYEDQGSFGESDVGAFGHGGTENSYWIIARNGDRTRALQIPLYRCAKEEISPDDSGSLVIFEQYPNGMIREYYMGTVRSGRTYNAWFRADSRGIHTCWYRVDGGRRSDVIRYRVY